MANSARILFEAYRIFAYVCFMY